MNYSEGFTNIVHNAISALAAFFGVIIGAWLTSRRERSHRKLEFIKEQLRDFYSPLLGVRNEIKVLSEFREKIVKTSHKEWQELCDKARQDGGPKYLGEISQEKGKRYEKSIDYDNMQFREKLLPAYRNMIKIFRDNLRLADKETEQYFEKLIRFVETWDRWLAEAIPPEVVKALDVGEKELLPFYSHLQIKHDELRSKLVQGKP